MAVVYQHIRKTDNTIFYIGIGGDVKRAYSIKGRNRIWKSISSRCGYTVDILHTDIDLDEARKTEIELISKYGRIDLGTGILSNMTDGGESTINLSKEVRKVLSDKKKGLYDGENNPAFINRKSDLPLYIKREKRKPLYNKYSGELNKIYTCGLDSKSFSSLEEAVEHRDNILKNKK
jgi:hypothetical protein